MLHRLRSLKPALKAGMTDEEARAYGTLPPLGFTPPRPPPLREALRGGVVMAFAGLNLIEALIRWRGGKGLEPQAAYDRLRAITRAALDHLGIQLEVIGHPPSPGVILMWNQESHLDHLVLPAVIPMFPRALYNIELSRFPLYGDYLARTGNYLVNRHDEPQWRASIARAAADVAERGVTILVSPEGTRSWDGQLLMMKRGAFLLAIAAQAPIVPITLVGGHQRLPRTASIVRPGKIIAVWGQPIPTAGLGEHDMPALQQKLAEVFRQTKAAHRARV